MWDLIVSVPDHCLSFYFGMQFVRPKKPIYRVAPKLNLITRNDFLTKENNLIAKRQFHRKQQADIETLNADNPREFCICIK